MKPLLRVGVPLWSLLICGALLEICQAENATTAATVTAATATAATVTEATGTAAAATAATTAATATATATSTAATATSTAATVTAATAATTETATSGLSSSARTDTSVISTVTSSVPGTVYTSTPHITTQPIVITDLQVTDFTTSSASLNWTKSTGELSHFTVQWTNVSGNFNATTNETSYTITNLTPGVAYNVTVSAVAADGQTGKGQTDSFRTRPGKVEQFRVEHTNTSSISLSWTAPRGSVFRYKVDWDAGKDKKSLFTSDVSAVLSGLNSGTSYTITITAMAEGNLAGEPFSLSVVTKPAVVENLTITTVTTSSVSLSWAKPEGNASSYTIRWTGEGISREKNSTETSTVVEDLTPGSQYDISVAAVSASTEGESVSKMTFTLPEKPENITLTERGTENLIISWSLPKGNRQQFTVNITELGLECVYSNTTTTADIPKMGLGCVYSNTMEPANITRLEPGSLYTISVSAVAGNFTETSEHQQFSTMPKAVANLTVKDVNMTAIELNWDRPVGGLTHVTTYVVTARQTSTVVHNDTTTNENYTFINLNPGTLYDFQVFAVVLGVKSKVNNVSSDTKPAPVTDVIVTGSTTDLSVSWKAAAGEVVSYDIFLYQDNQLVSNKTVDNRTENVVFTNQASGVLYCVLVTSKSASFETNSSQVCNATDPNPPGPIIVESQNTHSINFSWPRPDNMDHQQYNFRVSSSNDHMTTTPNNWFLLDNLQSGTLYNISVVTVGVLNYSSIAVAAENYTRPYPVYNLTGVQINRNTMNLTWEQQESKPHYSYVVFMSGFSPRISNISALLISGLTSGSQYNITVISQTGGGTQAIPPTTITFYTEPEGVQPTISNQGSNDSLLVSWSAPEGSVQHYLVHLNSSFPQEDKVVTANSLTKQHLFGNLSAGRLYSVQIAVRSGPINTTSELVFNATVPNPPGPLDIMAKTNSSIDITWEEAPLMTAGSLTYKLFINVSEEAVQVPGTNTSHTFASLRSGTPYNISVVTVGALDFESEKVNVYMVNTRPFSVSNLIVSSVKEDQIQLAWDHPGEYKESYRYNVTYTNSEKVLSQQIQENTSKISNLVPGTSYTFNVTTETYDGTQADSKWISRCTAASPVSGLQCEGPNTADASLLLSWASPKGHYTTFLVTINDGEIFNKTVTCCSHNFSGLQHHTSYNLMVVTQSCGQPSNSIMFQGCWTGITNPPIVTGFDSLVIVSEKTHNKFSVQIDPRLLNDTNGPITHVGVLVSSTLSGNASEWRMYLGKAYDEWKAGQAPAYLATVKNVSASRSTESHLTLQVGDESKWESYSNGALDSSQKYYYAVVVFTNLSLDKNLVNGITSLVSSTEFYLFVELNANPVISIAIGATLGIFLVFFIILIGFIIYWRRLSQKEETDIQIHSMRAKVSVAVRMEDYEVYYRKQKADSNCGFAEEFEDLKPVGTDQPKTSALILENKPKNRYNNVLPYDSSRVKLSIIHGSPYDDYINANYMPGYNSKKEFIAAQGPLPATVNDFWRMIWEKNVQTLVMLTRCNEQGRVKCEQYWDFGTRRFQNINVTAVSDIPLEDWTIRDFDVKNVKTAETRSVRQFHFTAWPDHGVPETTELLISFRHLVREHMDQYSRHSPTVVHCSAGVGRTGTFIAIDRLIFQIERENIVDVYGIVHDLRMHRPLMVQTEDQYVFLNQCAMDIIRSRTGTNVDLIYQNTAALSIYENVDLHKGYYRYPDA